MKKIFLIPVLALGLASCNSGEKAASDYQYKDVPFTNVHFTDNFWAPRIETIRSVTIPFAFKKCEDTHRIDNFAVAGGLMEGKFNSPYPFDDSDVYKIMEGASYILAVQDDPALDHYIDSLITLIGAAQEPTVISTLPVPSVARRCIPGPEANGGRTNATTATSSTM